VEGRVMADFADDIHKLMEATDPNEAWKRIVQSARAAKKAVEVVVEFNPPSEHAGRRMRLFYDPTTDQEGHQWLDWNIDANHHGNGTVH
jgi:hypothetical protein